MTGGVWARRCSYLDFQHVRLLRHPRSSRAYPVITSDRRSPPAKGDCCPGGRRPSALRLPGVPAVAWPGSGLDGATMNAAVLVSDRRRRGRAWHVPRLLGIVAALGLTAASCGHQGATPSAGHQSPTASAGHQSGTASPGPTGSTTSPTPGGCASQSHPANFAYSGSPASSITVCPGRAPVGAVVHITLQGCGTPSQAASALVFLGPSSFIGSGGGGDDVPFKPVGGDRATATFKIPATYVGGETGASPNPPCRSGQANITRSRPTLPGSATSSSPSRRECYSEPTQRGCASDRRVSWFRSHEADR